MKSLFHLLGSLLLLTGLVALLPACNTGGKALCTVLKVHIAEHNIVTVFDVADILSALRAVLGLNAALFVKILRLYRFKG